MEHKITLYQFPDCPYCARVRAKLEELGLPYETVNVSRDRESAERVEIREKSGVSTVPVADIDSMWVGDSAKIIEKLEKLV